MKGAPKMQVIDFVNTADETVAVKVYDVTGRTIYTGAVVYLPFEYLKANVQRLDLGDGCIGLWTDIEPAAAEE